MITLKHTNLADLLTDREEQDRVELTVAERKVIADKSWAPRRDEETAT